MVIVKILFQKHFFEIPVHKKNDKIRMNSERSVNSFEMKIGYSSFRYGILAQNPKFVTLRSFCKSFKRISKT